MQKPHTKNWSGPTQLTLVLVLSLVAAGCFDTRSAAHSTVGFLAGGQDASTEPSSRPRNVGDAEPIGLADDQQAPDSLTVNSAESPGRSSAFGLRWIAAPSPQVGWPVRDLPREGAEVVGSLAAWETDFWVAERTRQTASGLWRRVTLSDGTTGWVQANNLFAQPETLSTKDMLEIDRITGLDLDGIVGSATEVPTSVHSVIATVEGKTVVLLLDWSKREMELIALFLDTAG